MLLDQTLETEQPLHRAMRSQNYYLYASQELPVFSSGVTTCPVGGNYYNDSNTIYSFTHIPLSHHGLFTNVLSEGLPDSIVKIFIVPRLGRTTTWNKLIVSGSLSGSHVVTSGCDESAVFQHSRWRLSLELFAQIDALVSYYPAVTQEAGRLAKSLIAFLPSSIPLPQARGSDDGEIGLFWLKGTDRVEATLDSDEKRIIWIGKFEGAFVRGGDEDWSDTPPDGLIDMLQRLYK